VGISVPNLQQLASGLPESVQQALRSALAAQDTFNRNVADAFNALADFTWQTPTTFQNGWLNFDATHYARFTKLQTGIIVLDGVIKSGTVGSTAFTLPLGYRPGIIDMNFAADSNVTPARLQVGTNGNVIPTTGGNGYYSLCCMFLPAVT
jgi:hypothetical protein